MRKAFLIVVVIAAAAAITAVLVAHRKESKDTAQRPSVVPYVDLRNEVKGKTVADVSKIVLQVPGVKVITVKDKADITGLLNGLREAVVVDEEDKLCCAGPVVTIYWADGKKSYDYGFIDSDGPERAFGEKFARAYNRLVPPANRVNLTPVKATE